MNYLSNSRRCLTIVFGWKKLGWKKKVNAAKNMHEIYLKHCLHTSNPPGTTTTHTTTTTPFLPFPRTTSQHNNGSNAKIIIHNKKISKSTSLRCCVGFSFLFVKCGVEKHRLFFFVVVVNFQWMKKRASSKLHPLFPPVKKPLCAGKHCTYLPPFFLGRRTAWMLGNTPPAAMVVLEKSLFNSSSLRTANWM